MTLPNNYEYITSLGVIVPDTSDTLEEVKEEYRSIFGQEINLSPTEPPGLLAEAEALSRNTLLRSNADTANQINPNITGGAFLDAICELTALQRQAAIKTSVFNVVLSGVPSSTVPSGSVARTVSGDNFILLSSVVIGPGGTVTGTFQSEVAGPIPCLAGTLTDVVSEVLGWETVNNPDDGILGAEEQSDVSLRKLRKNALALQGASSVPAMISNLYATEGVLSLTFRENITDAPQVIDGVNLLPNSVWACVDGGVDEDVGFALLDGKSTGSNYNGSVTVQVKEPSSKQLYPVKFERPIDVNLYVRATIQIVVASENPQQAISTAILNWANNSVQDIEGLTVGNNASPAEIAAAIQVQVTGIYMDTIEVSDDGVSWQTVPYNIEIFEVGRLTSDRITVVLI